jgi:transposase
MDKVIVIGMDMGDKNHKAVGLAENGEIVDRCEVACTPAAVREYLMRHPGALLVIETGTHCRWVCRIGLRLGHAVLVGNARKLRMIWQSSRKNDWNDAEMLARLGRTDPKLLSPVRLRDDEAQELLRLLKVRDLLVKERTMIVTQIRGFCKSEGARLPSCSSEAFGRKDFETPASLRMVTKPLFAVLRELNKKIGLYDKMIAKVLKTKYADDAKLLESVNGAGPVTVAAFLATIGDPATFGDARDAGPYYGLVPKQDQSGETDKQKRISKEGNEMVRRLLVTAATYIMGPFGKDCDLRRHGLKIAVLMLAMLKNRIPYRPLMQVENPV